MLRSLRDKLSETLHPELDGQEYAWPETFDWASHSTADLERFANFHRKAAIKLKADYPGVIPELRVVTTAGRSAQGPNINVRVTGLSGDKAAEIENILISDMAELVAHPSAPVRLSEIKGAGNSVGADPAGNVRIRSMPLFLGNHTINNDISAHETIEAISLFRKE